MELITQTVFKKAVSSAIVNGVKSLCNSISNSIFESKEMGRVLFEKSNFSTLIEADIESIENEINSFGGYPNINSENICVFFEYPEIESIIRQIYATNFPCISSHEESIEAIKDEFILLLAKYFNIEKEKIAGLASILFDILIEGCHETIKNQISNGKNIAFEALSNYQMKLILDELETINKNIDLLSRNDIDPKSFQEFFKKYTELLKKRHEWIATSTFEGNTRKPINKIYVCPDIINRSNILKTTELNNQYDDNQMFEFFEFLSKIHRVVLLGDPGNGKTTFTKKVCYELSARYSERLFSGREIVPFVVVVKDYHAEKIRTNVSIIEFVSMELRNDFQINPPENAIEYLLFNGYIFLIFDGLDEILDIKAREKMVNEIESFCNLYPSIPVIITSRKIGYEEAALRNDMFEIWELASFNINQIQEYVEKWFNMDDDLRLTQKNQKIDSFMKESEKVSDLRSNSLMLALMCNIYKQENYIPENRPRIYQKCAEMLYKKWDRSRGIAPKMRLQDSKLEPLISYLAYWIYTNDFSNGWTTESELVNKAAEYLHHATYEDYDDAKEVAKDFIDFSKGRAWIFTYVGIVKNQNVYQFTHRTFLEYFTAEWLCRVYEETDKLTNELVPKIGQRQWDVVAQLAFQIRGEKSENATDKILLNILDKTDNSTEVEYGNLISFVATSLEFMTPSPNVVKKIIIQFFEYSLYIGKKNIQNEKFEPMFPNSRSPHEIIKSLKNSIPVNRMKIAETLKNLVFRYIESDNAHEAIIAAEITFELESKKNSEKQPYWSEMLDGLSKECYVLNPSVFEDNVHLCIKFYAILFDKKIETMLQLHGLEGIILDYSAYINPNLRTSGIGQMLVSSNVPAKYHYSNTTFDDYVATIIQDTSNSLKKVGDFCLENILPVTVMGRGISGIYMYKESLRYPEDEFTEEKNRFCILDKHLDASAIFGGFCLLAILFELNSESRNTKNSCKSLIKRIDLRPLNTIFIAWLDGIDNESIEKELETIGFSQRQHDFIFDWIEKKTSFLV